MKQLNKIVFSFAAFALAAVSAPALPEASPQKAWRSTKANASQKVIAATPKILSEKMVICGNKKLLIGNGGKIVLSNVSSIIATITPYTTFTVKDNGKIEWTPITDKACKLRMQNGKIVWDLYKEKNGKTFKVAKQVLEVTKDGLLRLSAEFENVDNEMLKIRRNGAFFVTTPIAGNEGRKIRFNGGEDLIISNDLKHGDWKVKEHKYEVYYDSPVDTFTLLSKKADFEATAVYRVGKEIRFAYNFSKTRKASILIDLRKAGEEKIDSANTGAGVDFKRTENLELPYKVKNLVFNSSFEQKMLGWKAHIGLLGHHEFKSEKWNSNPFTVVEQGYHGKHALLLKGRHSTHRDDYRHINKGVNIDTPTVFLNPGLYTLSFYAKQISGDKNTLFNAWNHNFNTTTSTIFLPPHSSGKSTYKLTNEWKRYTMTFRMDKAAPTTISFNVNGKAEVLLDAVQIEGGHIATKYTPPSAEGLLITSSSDNFISAKEKVDAKLRVFTKANEKGKVKVRVKNFFDEIVCSTEKEFTADKDGYAFVELPFENLGKGIFTVRFDYTLSDGRTCFNHARYVVMDFLDNTHRLKGLFSETYHTMEKHHLFIKILDRYRKLGVGAISHMFNWDKEIWDKYLEYGVEPTSAFLVTNLWAPGTTKVTNFGIKYKKTLSRYSNDKDLAIGDHNISNNGEFDDAYLKRFTDVTAEIARRYPHIKLWAMQGEVRAKYGNDWWSKAGTEEEASRRHALYLKAVTEGIRRGNPEAKVFQDDPCNMRPEGGIAETAELLKNCNKIGVRFDVLAIHPYRNSPESPDLDADTQLFFKTVAEQGYGKDVKVMWPEMMHWGPFNIPQWGTISSTWGNVPRTWPGWMVSFDIGATEKLSAAWRARSWLVALKHSDRITTATSGGGGNNFHMDEELTPYCSSLMPNTLGNLLGDSKFAADIRFAPFCRAYIFTDQENRPVAAVWCHLDKVDNGYIDAPMAEADFGSSLESVIDLMNNKRAFTAGKYKFPVTSFPLFLRGKPGTLNKMIAAFKKAEIVSGDGISPLEVTCNPADAKNVRVSFKNLLSRDFAGEFNSKKVVVPASGTGDITLPFASPLAANRVTQVMLPGVFKTVTGQKFDYDLSFEAMTAKKVADGATFDNIDWNKIPMVKFTRNMRKRETTGNYRIGWNNAGIFIQVQVKDKKFTHTEYKNTGSRWKNDCLQIYFDTMANARFRQFKGYDEDDYDYALFPNSKGDSSIVWRNRSVEQQLGLATQAPKDQTVADDIPSSFSNKDGVLTYRVFFPAKYLLPMKLRAGWVFGFGLYVPNCNVPGGVVTSALTNATNGGACFNAPHVYPAVLLVD